MFIALALLLTACEKPILSEEDIVSTQDANVILHFKQYEQESFTRAAANQRLGMTNARASTALLLLRASIVAHISAAVLLFYTTNIRNFSK